MTEEDMFDHMEKMNMDKILGEKSWEKSMILDVESNSGEHKVVRHDSKPREHPYWKMHDVWGYKVVLNAKGLKLWGVEDE